MSAMSLTTSICMATLAMVLLSESKSLQEDSLKTVFVIHRHGDRNPIYSYPTDPFKNDSYFPDGIGELISKGKRRMFGVGKYLAKRYQGFLGTSPHEVYIRSSAEPRCLESVALVLAGLYPPVKRWQWNDDLGKVWQPFPINTINLTEDGMLNPVSQCKAAEKEIDKIYKSSEIVEYQNKLNKTLEIIRVKCGMDKPFGLNEAAKIYDTLLVERQNNLTLPTWVSDQLFHTLMELNNKVFEFNGSTPKIQRLRSGLLLQDIVNRIENKRDKQINIYSTHDTQLSVFLQSLDAFNGKAPPYGTTLMLELHQSQQVGEYLKAFYLNDTESEYAHPLTLKRCGYDPCPVIEFIRSIAHLKIAREMIQWNEECQQD